MNSTQGLEQRLNALKSNAPVLEDEMALLEKMPSDDSSDDSSDAPSSTKRKTKTSKTKVTKSFIIDYIHLT